VDAAESLPLVQAVKSAFPGAAIRKVTPRAPDQMAGLEAAPDDMYDDAADENALLADEKE